MNAIETIGPRKVRITRLGVQLFNATWPGSVMADSRSYWFEFDADRNLIDCDVPNESDGGEALAMSHDAERFLFDDEIPDWARIAHA